LLQPYSAHARCFYAAAVYAYVLPPPYYHTRAIAAMPRRYHFRASLMATRLFSLRCRHACRYAAAAIDITLPPRYIPCRYRFFDILRFAITPCRLLLYAAPC